MWEHADSTALAGLRYLTFLGGAAAPPIDAFAAYLEQPRPERKSLTDAVQASKAPSGHDILHWCDRVGWIVVDDDSVAITELGRTVVGLVDGQRAGDDLDAELEELVAGEQARDSDVAEDAESDDDTDDADAVVIHVETDSGDADEVVETEAADS